MSRNNFLLSDEFVSSFQFTADGPVGPDMDRAPSPVVPDPSPGVVAVITPPQLTAVTPARGPLPPPGAVTHTTVQVRIVPGYK